MKALWFPYLFLAVFLVSCQTDTQNSKQSHPRSSVGNSVLHLSTSSFPDHVDPRLATNAKNQTLCSLFFSGLTRLDSKGNATEHMASSIALSEDERTYTIVLKESKWSNDQPVTANDYLYTWQSKPSILKLLGIKELEVKDPKTLVIELYRSNPQFLTLLASPLTFPVSKQADESNPDWNEEFPGQFVCNGPFRIKTWAVGNLILAEQNPGFPSDNSISIKEVQIYSVPGRTAAEMWQHGAVDWIGAPLDTLSLPIAKRFDQYGFLKHFSPEGLVYFSLPLESDIFQDQLMRQAFSEALKRDQIPKKSIRQNPEPAKRILPQSLLDDPRIIPLETKTVQATERFYQALDELSLKKDALPPITIIYEEGDKLWAESAKRDWNSAFGLHTATAVKGSEIPKNSLVIELKRFFSTFPTPEAFLEELIEQDEIPDHQHLSRILEQASIAKEQGDWTNLILEAETKLLEELPLIPYAFPKVFFAKNPLLRSYHISSVGAIDFTQATVEPSPIEMNELVK